MKVPNELKVCRVFSATLPPVEPMTQHLSGEDVTWRGIHEHEIKHAGFAVNPATGHLVSHLGDGSYHFCIRVDEKILPAAVVNRKLEERIALHLEKYPQAIIGRRERSEFKDEVLLDMISTAEYKSRYIHCFYYQGPEHNRLYVARTSDNDITLVSTLLIRAVSSIETRTIHIDGLALGLGARVKDALTNGHSEANLATFDLGERVVVEYTGGEGKFTIAGRDLYECSDEILEALSGGSLKEVELSHGPVRSPVFARITDNFHFKGVAFSDVDMEGEVDEDYPHCWVQTHAANLLMLEALVQDLATMMGYREPEQTKCKHCDEHFDSQHDYEEHLACGCPYRYDMDDLV